MYFEKVRPLWDAQDKTVCHNSILIVWTTEMLFCSLETG